MKYLFLLFCIILCSCEYNSGKRGTCIPMEGGGFRFNLQGGIDSTDIYDSWWSFTGVRKEEECEIKPDTIECSWFSMVKRESIVFASVKQNNTGQKRKVDVKIKGKGGRGECSDEWGEISIIQCPEPMELSKDEFLFSSEGGMDSVIVTTDRNSWLEYPLINLQYKTIGAMCYISQESFKCYGDTIKDHWIAIDIKDGEKITLSVSKNESGKERISILIFDPWMYWDCCPSVNIVQAAE